MARGDELRPGVRRGGLVLVAAVLWILIIVVGAGSDADDSLLGVDNFDVVWIIVFGIIVLLSIAFMIFLNPFSGEWVAPKEKRGIGLWFLVALALVLMVWRPNVFEGLGEQEDVEDEIADIIEPGIAPVVEEPAPETVAQATDILLLLVGVAAIGGLWFVVRRRSSAVVDDDEQHATALEIDLVQALDHAARELDASTDPRTAVLRSYAVLETVLASHGLTRAAAETPAEHLGRSLRNLRTDAEPMVQLGRLYEVARFSDRSISKTEQDAAAEALRRAQTSLASLV